MKPLNPIMAVLVIASVGASPLRTLASGGTEPVGVAVAVKPEDTDSITRLTEILNNKAGFPAAVADAGERVSDFLLNPNGDKNFVASDVDRVAAKAVVLDWAKKQKPGDLAMLYFVVGTGDKPPKWVSDDKLLAKTVLPKREVEGRLREKLSRFTEATGAQIKHIEEGPKTMEFLDVAAKEARDIFDHPTTTVATDDSVNRNNNTGVKPPDTTRGAGSQFDGGARQYTLDDLYGEPGARVVEVAGPDDKNSRRISVKVYTSRAEDGTLIREIGIFDITNTADIFGRRFPIGGGDQAFVLDDRTPGHKKYELKFGPAKKNGDQDITFARPGKGGTPLSTSVFDLFNRRADQASAMNNIVKVGNEEFYVVPQGGVKSALALFPKAAIDARRSGGDARDLVPSLYAEIGQRGSDGRNENIPPGKGGGPQLGEVGGVKYHLVFNKALGVWEVAEGEGDLTTPPPAPVKPGTSRSTDEVDPATGRTTDEDTTPGSEMAIADLEKLLLVSPKCKKNPDDTKLMAEGLKDKYSIISCNLIGKPEGEQAILLVPMAVKPHQQMVFASIKGDDTVRPPREAMMLLRGRIVDHYVVLQFDKQVQYLDLLRPTENGFELEGFVANKDAGGPPQSDPTRDRPGMKNIIIFIDALRNYMGVPANSGVFAAVPERAKKISADSYDLQAKYADTTLMVFARKGNGPHVEIWPNFATAPAGPASGQYAGLSGPTNVMEREVSSVDAPFESSFDIPNSFKLVLEGAAQKDIALYKAKDPTGKEDPNKYYVSFKYLAMDPNEPSKPEGPATKKIFRQKYFEVFNADNPLPAARAMQGLTTGSPEVLVRGQLAYKFVSGTSREKGVLAVVQNGQLSGEGQKDPASNCVGPIIWWGVASREAALKVCKNDKF